MEQASANGAPVPDDDDDDDDDDEDDEDESVNAEFSRWSEEEDGTGDDKSSLRKGNAVDSAAHALLSSITQPLGASGATPGDASSTIDMKALGGTTAWNNNDPNTTASAGTVNDLKPSASTLDMNALKWQNASGQPAQAQGDASKALKRSSSVDSPGQDEERLTVVEADDSSQDSESTKAPQDDPQSRQQQTTV